MSGALRGHFIALLLTTVRACYLWLNQDCPRLDLNREAKGTRSGLCFPSTLLSLQRGNTAASGGGARGGDTVITR